MQYVITCIIQSDKFEHGDCPAYQANYMQLSSLVQVWIV